MSSFTQTDGQITIQLKLETDGYEKSLKNVAKKSSSMADIIKGTFVGKTLFSVASRGYQLIAGSVGKATARLDAMGKATNVMSILSGSTEKASQVVQELTDAVSDTAYGLDAAATSTQKLATSGLDLDDSARMVKNLMDAVSFYGDGTNETLENVVDAMAKMNSSGKISADQWQRLTDAGIPVLKIFAEKTGKSMAEVSDAFSKGKISAQDFDAILTDALENGTQSFPAVAGKAKEMAGSFATSFSNMSARIAIGVANVITAFNNFVQDSGLPSIQTMIADFGSVIKNGLNWVADNMPAILNGIIDLVKKVGDSMPNLTNAIRTVVDYVQQNAGGTVDVIKEALKWLIDNIPAVTGVLDSLSPAIIAIGVAFATWKFLSTVQKVTSLLQTGFLNAIFNVSKAINLLSGNPIMLIVSAIAALVAGFLYLWNTSEDFRNFWIGLWDTVKTAAGTVVDGVVTFFTETIPEAFNSFVEACQSVADSVATFFTETIPQAILNFVQAVIQFFTVDLPYGIGYGIGWIIGKIAEFGQNLINFATTTVPQFIQSVIDWFMQLPGQIQAWLLAVLSNIAQWGADMISDGAEAASEFLTNIINWFRQLPGQIQAWLLTTIHNLGSWVTDMKDKAIDAGTKFKDGLVDEVKKIPGKMLSLGGDIVDGIKNGIKNAWSGLTGWFGNLASGLIDGFKDALGIGSPSKEFDKEARWIGPGVINGLKRTMPDAIRYMEKASAEMLSVLDRDSLATRINLEGHSFNPGKAKGTGNTYVVNQTVNSHDALSPSEMAQETKNAIRRAAWQ
jgi:tape measure domain-containing protein